MQPEQMSSSPSVNKPTKKLLSMAEYEQQARVATEEETRKLVEYLRSHPHEASKAVHLQEKLYSFRKVERLLYTAGLLLDFVFMSAVLWLADPATTSTVTNIQATTLEPTLVANLCELGGIALSPPAGFAGAIAVFMIWIATMQLENMTIAQSITGNLQIVKTALRSIQSFGLCLCTIVGVLGLLSFKLHQCDALLESTTLFLASRPFGPYQFALGASSWLGSGITAAAVFTVAFAESISCILRCALSSFQMFAVTVVLLVVPFLAGLSPALGIELMVLVVLIRIVYAFYEAWKIPQTKPTTVTAAAVAQ